MLKRLMAKLAVGVAVVGLAVAGRGDQQVIGIGVAANAGGGDPLRTICIKCNANFAELYGQSNYWALVTSNLQVAVVQSSNAVSSNLLVQLISAINVATNYANTNVLAQLASAINGATNNAATNLTAQLSVAIAGATNYSATNLAGMATTLTGTVLQSSNGVVGSISSFATPTPKNLFNPSNAVDGVFRNYGSTLGVNPSYVTNANYAETGLLPVRAGNSYVFWFTNTETFNLDSYYNCYDAWSNFVGTSSFVSVNYLQCPGVSSYAASGGANPGRKWVSLVLSPACGVSYVQIMLINGAAHTSADFTRLVGETKFELGTNATPYSPYNVVEGWQLTDGAMPVSYSAGATNVAWGNSQMRIIKTGNSVWIRSPWSTNLDFVQQLTLGIYATPYDNNQVEMWRYGTAPNTAADTNIIASMTSLKSIQDDICPTKFNASWMGANHGWNSVVNVGVSSHDKTAPDVGSEWTDGAAVKWYLVSVQSATNLWFLSAGTNDMDFTTSMTGNLTHSAGAAHTTGITVASKTVAQLYPSIKNQSKRILLNGLADLSWDGTYNARFLDVQHSYDIDGLGSILAFVRAHLGSTPAPAFDDPSIAVEARITTTYHYTPNGACTVFRTFKAYTNITMQYDGVVQSGPVVIPSGGKLWQYIPKTVALTTVSNAYNTGATHTYTFTNLTDITSYNDEIWLGKTGWAYTNSPPDRFIQIVTDSGGNKTFGFACGLSPRIGVTQTNSRSVSITNAFYMYPGQKNYPFAVDSSAYPTNMPANTTMDAVAFRCPINFTSYTNATSVCWYYVGKDAYWMADFHTNVADYVPVATDLWNRQIEVVESTASAAVNSKFVTPDGIKLTVTNNYGYVVLRLFE